MPQGPLIPGVQEFDRPRRGWPAWLRWTLLGVLVALVVLVAAGFVGGTGPFRFLGTRTIAVESVAYRTTSDPAVIQVGVAVPNDGMCRDDQIEVVAFERSNRVELEGSITRSRDESCADVVLGGDLRWVDVPLAAPLADRTVIRLPDREAVPVR
jgi:hypothetical protein